MKKLIFLLLITLSTTLMAQKLVVNHGIVKAHTEVFGDSSINPATTGIISHLTMGKDITSIKGSVDVSILKLKSDNSDRDERMAEALESKSYPISTYTFSSVKKSSHGYLINGILNFHGVKKPLQIHATITKHGRKIHFLGKSSFLLSDYKIKPIKLLFLTVRNKIDLAIDVTFKK